MFRAEEAGSPYLLLPSSPELQLGGDQLASTPLCHLVLCVFRSTKIPAKFSKIVPVICCCCCFVIRMVQFQVWNRTQFNLEFDPGCWISSVVSELNFVAARSAVDA